MESMYYIGLDVHKRKISYCVKDSGDKVYAEGSLPATRTDLDHWMKTLPQPWSAAVEATMFTGWIYDHPEATCSAVKVAHPLMLRAIAAAKKKNDRIDANKICRLPALRFPAGVLHGLSRRFARGGARYATATCWCVRWCRVKIKISSLLMEAGVSYNKQRLHKAGYFRELLATNPDIDEGLRALRFFSARPARSRR